MTARRALFGVVVLFSLVVLFAPAGDTPSSLPVGDKVIHAVMFAALATSGLLAEVSLVPLAIGLAVYAGVSEVLQAALPIDRDGDWHDALADVIGMTVGLLLVTWGWRQRP